MGASHHRRSGMKSPLSPRETQVLELAAIGLTNKQAAQVLNISVETVKDFHRFAKAKLMASTVTHAVAIAMRKEWIKP